MARMAVTLDQALVLTDDVLGDRKPEPGTVRAAADHRVKNGFLKVGRNPGAVVDDFDLAHQPMTYMSDGELAHRAGAQGDAAQAQFVLPADGLHRVAHDIEHGLDH